jgi:hypothetical protein
MQNGVLLVASGNVRACAPVARPAGVAGAGQTPANAMGGIFVVQDDGSA